MGQNITMKFNAMVTGCIGPFPALTEVKNALCEITFSVDNDGVMIVRDIKELPFAEEIIEEKLEEKQEEKQSAICSIHGSFYSGYISCPICSIQTKDEENKKYQNVNSRKELIQKVQMEKEKIEIKKELSMIEVDNTEFNAQQKELWKNIKTEEFNLDSWVKSVEKKKEK